MARTKARPAAAPSAAHAAPAPAPEPNAAAAPGSPAAAVHAALAASPGATTAVIADTAAIGKPAARDTLLAMEKAGTATRARGGKPGIPDTWTLAGTTPDSAGPAADPEDEQGDQPDDGPAGSSLTGAGGDEAAGEDGLKGTAETAGAGQQDGDAGASTSAAPDPGTEKPGTHDDAPAGGDREDAYPGKYVTCVYSHAKALCGGDSQPDLASCQPLRCRNVALTPGNRDTLAEEIASLDAALTAVPVLPPLLQHRLRDRRQAIADFLARNQPEPA